MQQRGTVWLVVLALALLSCGTGERPEYVGDFEGNGAVAFLDQMDDELFYLNLQLEGQVYTAGAEYSDGVLTGSLDDFGQLPFSIEAQAGGEELVLTAAGQTYRLRRIGDLPAGDSTTERIASSEPGEALQSQSPTPPAAGAAGNRDSRLVGSYSRQEIVSTPQGSIATQMFLEIRADGTFSEVMGDTLGGGMDWSGQVGGAGGAQTAEWSTQNGVFLVKMPGMTQWVPLARYVLQPGRLMFVYNDGSQHLWYRS